MIATSEFTTLVLGKVATLETVLHVFQNDTGLSAISIWAESLNVTLYLWGWNCKIDSGVGSWAAKLGGGRLFAIVLGSDALWVPPNQ